MQDGLDAMVTTLILALGAGAAAEAAEPQQEKTPTVPPKDPQASFEPRSKPGDGQKLMERMVGEWDVRKTISPPGREPAITGGSCRQTMMHEGRFLKSEFTFHELDGSTTSGLGILGFDARSGTFSSVWTDSRSTRMSLRQSEGEFNGKEILLHGRTLGAAGEDARHSRTNAHLSDDDKILTHQQFNTGPDGKEYRIMELYMTRKKA